LLITYFARTCSVIRLETNGEDVVSYITGAKTAPEYATAG
jgi:hypothetical protein